MARITFTVRLNGTDVNPYHQYGLTRNPFPQILDSRYAGHIIHIQKLGCDPVPNIDHIRKHLEGWDQPFVDFVCSKFEPGKMVTFDVHFDE